MTVGRVNPGGRRGRSLQPEPTARVTQQALELLQQPAPRARVTGQALEVLRSVAGATASSSRRPVMILCVGG